MELQKNNIMLNCQVLRSEILQDFSIKYFITAWLPARINFIYSILSKTCEFVIYVILTKTIALFPKLSDPLKIILQNFSINHFITAWRSAT